MSALWRWLTEDRSTYERPFKVLAVFEVLGALFWIGLFIWFETLQRDAPGVFELRAAAITSLQGHLGSPATVRGALVGLQREGRLRWINIWWLLLSVAMDFQNVFTAFQYLQATPEHSLTGLKVFTIYQVVLSGFVTVAFVLVRCHQSPQVDGVGAEMPLLKRRNREFI